MRKVMMSLIGIVCVLSVWAAHAAQIKAAKDNQTILVNISAKQPTRIFVLGDRIIKTYGIEGAYEINKDENKGEIFVQPTLAYQQKTISLFIATEHGHSYTLSLIPTDSPAENIELKPISPARQYANRWERNSPYVQTLINLINAMVEEKRPEGYAVIDMGEGKARKLSSGLTLQLLTIYRGDHLQSEIWLLKNCSKKTRLLHAKEFSQKNTRAISFEDEVVESGDEIYLYRVVDHGQ